MYKRTRLGVTYNLACVLIYLLPFVGSIILLISDGKDRDIKYNGVMSLYMSVAEAVSIIFLALLGKIPYIGWFFTLTLWVVTVFYIACMLLSLARAINGKVLKIPFFYTLTQRTIY